MGTVFERWAKDPFFSAAEEVQESADRMESVYRRWIHERKDSSNDSGELLRDLQTALGTAKWQLQELERAVRLSDEGCSAGEDTRTRHSQFVVAIGNKISTVEDSLRESSPEEEKNMSWARLDEGERDELAIFLSGPVLEKGKPPTIPCVGVFKVGENQLRINEEADCPKSCPSNESGQLEPKEKVHGHRRAASASADIGVLKISVSGEESQRSSDERPALPLPKIPSLSCLAKALESPPKVKWPKNGFRKWKIMDQHQAEELIPLRDPQCSRDINGYYGSSKNDRSKCGDECCDKQLYGWVGALHRQLQRSQYQIQYSRPVQMIFWTSFVLLLVVLVALHAI